MSVTTDISLPIPPEYHPDLFADRDDEFNRVFDLAQALAAGRPVPRRTVIFRGERGCGKSWLLLHLARKPEPLGRSRSDTKRPLASLKGVCSWYVDLRTYASKDAETVIKAIITDLRVQIGRWQNNNTPPFSVVPNLSLAELSRLALGDVSDLLQRQEQQVLVALLDHVYESQPEILELLEERLLASLAAKPKTLIVMAGRGRGFSWKAPELRISIEEYWLHGLGEPATKSPDAALSDAGMSLSATREQLSRLQTKGYPIQRQADEIAPETSGNPLANVLLAVGKSTTDVLEEQLRDIDAADRSLLKLLCVLRFFDEPQIQSLLVACQDGVEFSHVANMSPREVISSLLRTNLVRYDTAQSAYVMDEVIRRLLAGDLQEHYRESWRRLHCAAARTYQAWMNRHPQAKARLEAEANYHAEQLKKAGEDPNACPELQAQEES